MNDLLKTLGQISALEIVMAWKQSESRDIAALKLSRSITSGLSDMNVHFDLMNTWSPLSEVETDELKMLAISKNIGGPRFNVERYLRSLQDEKREAAMSYISYYAREAKDKLHDKVLEAFDV